MQMTSDKKKILIVLGLFLIFGAFFRTYQFHDWLHFGSDQARDAMLVEHVVVDGAAWPELGADASNTRFKLGPMYYYFQIIAAKLFGADPTVMAYPDVLFSLLTIPLFFLLLRRYFRLNLALALTGLFSVSFYLVEYARFAWNTNPIPFFMTLFLLAILELLEFREKTRFCFVVLLGVALGVGVQLHTLLLLLLPTLFGLVALFLLKQNKSVWQRLLLVLIIAVSLNAGQIKHEIETGGANSRLFFLAFTDRSGSGAGRFRMSLETDLLDHAEANTHILSALGDKANFTFRSTLYHSEKIKNRMLYAVSLGAILMSILFSVLGYGRLGYLAWRETNPRKKHFLVLITIYAGLAFLMMFSVARGMPLRYFISLTPVPFILLGLLLDWLGARVPKYSVIIIASVMMLLFLTNINALRIEAALLASGTRGEGGYVVLGEAERIVEYMIRQSAPGKEANFFGGTNYAMTYYKPLMYLAKKQDFTLVLADRKLPPVSDKPYFFMAQTPKKGDSFGISGYDLVGEKNFGRIGIHQLRKQ